MADNFFLSDLPTKQLKRIIELEESKKYRYFAQLIQRFYPDASDSTKAHLLAAYYSSFALEYIYRNQPVINSSFTCIYTSTGLLRELVNDLYSFDDPPYKYQIN